MKRERAYQLLEAIGEADDEKLEHSEREGRHRAWKKRGILAACFAAVLLAGVGGYAWLVSQWGFGNNKVGDSGHDASSVFMSYAGPVFPLTTLAGGEGLTAVRNICLDFSPWMPKENDGRNGSGDIIVTDCYTLTNPSMEDKTVEILYPFASSLYELNKNMVTLEADGKLLDARIYAGVYPGGVRANLEGAEEERLEQLDSWEKYRLLLSDGSYLEKTLSHSSDYSDFPAIVYRFTNAYGPERTEDIPNPTLRMMFSQDFERTKVLSYRFNQHYFDWENNIAGLGFSIPGPGEIGYGEAHYMVVLGDDIRDLEIKGYATGGWDTKNKLEDAGAEATREETSLEAILREIVKKEWENYLRNMEQSLQPAEEAYTVDAETYYQLYCDYLESFGFPYSEEFIQYDGGTLHITGVFAAERVCYAAAQVRIPAGESIVVKATMNKGGSFDYACAHTADQGIYGYDMMTKLGTNLALQESYATIMDYGQIEIVRQNFGFDLAGNIRTVLLDMGEEQYYLEVRPVE